MVARLVVGALCGASSDYCVLSATERISEFREKVSKIAPLGFSVLPSDCVFGECVTVPIGSRSDWKSVCDVCFA